MTKTAVQNIIYQFKHLDFNHMLIRLNDGSEERIEKNHMPVIQVWLDGTIEFEYSDALVYIDSNKIEEIKLFQKLNL